MRDPACGGARLVTKIRLLLVNMNFNPGLYPGPGLYSGFSFYPRTYGIWIFIYSITEQERKDQNNIWNCDDMIGIIIQVLIITGKYRPRHKYCALWSFPPPNKTPRPRWQSAGASPLPNVKGPNATAEAYSVGADVYCKMRSIRYWTKYCVQWVSNQISRFWLKITNFGQIVIS